jgi:hydroxymethylpyrimidine pyrophosphatase-like HAD family hydrolase
MPPGTRGLLALDLDGTLLRSDGSMDMRDLSAVRRVQAAGHAVTLATGRVTAAAIGISRTLRLDTPLVCADGRIVAHPRTGATERLFAIPSQRLAVAIMAQHRLAVIRMTPHRALVDRRARAHLGWLDPIECSYIDGSRPACERETIILLGLGDRGSVEQARAAALRSLGPEVAIDDYALGGGPHALRVWAAGRDKQTAVGELANHLGIPTERVAAVGDWYNDITMLRWAGRSFAMNGAPEVVCAAAGEVLDVRAGAGGGVAQAVDRWLGRPPFSSSAGRTVREPR